jgi:hypothetical protein
MVAVKSVKAASILSDFIKSIPNWYPSALFYLFWHSFYIVSSFLFFHRLPLNDPSIGYFLLRLFLTGQIWIGFTRG